MLRKTSDELDPMVKRFAASMRPQRNAAENMFVCMYKRCQSCCFNEAAA